MAQPYRPPPRSSPRSTPPARADDRFSHVSLPTGVSSPGSSLVTATSASGHRFPLLSFRSANSTAPQGRGRTALRRQGRRRGATTGEKGHVYGQDETDSNHIRSRSRDQDHSHDGGGAQTSSGRAKTTAGGQAYRSNEPQARAQGHANVQAAASHDSTASCSQTGRSDGQAGQRQIRPSWPGADGHGRSSQQRQQEQALRWWLPWPAARAFFRQTRPRRGIPQCRAASSDADACRGPSHGSRSARNYGSGHSGRCQALGDWRQAHHPAQRDHGA